MVPDKAIQTGGVVDTGQEISTGWEQWGYLVLDRGKPGSRMGFETRSVPAGFRHRPVIPTIHRPNRLHQSFYFYIVLD